MPEAPQSRGQKESLSLNDTVTHLLEECRMVVPGIQALFGFQLIAVFNERFAQHLTSGEQHLHLTAIVLTTISMGFVMAPAAYHRRIGTHEVSEHFISVTTRLLMLAMIPLMLGIALDVYLISRLIVGTKFVSLLVALLVLAIQSTLWFFLPRRP